MKSHTVRRLVTALAGSAALTAALAAPGVASASTQCSGGPVTGQGAAALKIAEVTVWGPGFNLGSNPTACSGTQGSEEKPKVSYTSSSSGAGGESWGINGHTASFVPTNAFIGTEEPPSLTQEEEIEKAGGAPLTTVLTIPVTQEAIAIIVHLPTGCLATSTAAPGRLVISNSILEKIFQGTSTEWKNITGDGDKYLNNGSEKCPIIVKGAKVHITRAVREDSAGTTAILKKYFFLTQKKAVSGTDTWDQLVATGTPNLTWPNESDTLIRVKGDSGLATKVGTEPGTIGYVSLADARASLDFTPSPGTGGPNTAAFWLEVQNGSGVYADPSTDGDVAAKANSNCEGTKYTNGKKKFPPPTTLEQWNEVTTAVKETEYTICNFAFDLALDGYHNYPSTTAGEALTVENFLQFTLNSASEGGQQIILNNDYLPLPTSTEPKQNVLKIAQEGASKVTF
jgi:ABC-type phosphate transport system substrate-binding protein